MLKHSGSWYRESEDVISVLNLQKSQYSLSYYVNVGFWIKALGEERFPKEHKCHVRVRLGDLVPDRTEEVTALLDLVHEFPGRIERLHDLLEGQTKLFLDRASSLDGLRLLRREGRLTEAFILSPAVALLRAA